MRTRNADNAKSGPGRKAAQAKKEAAAADKSPETAPKSSPKATPKSSGGRVTRGKQSTPKATAAAAHAVSDITTAGSNRVEEKGNPDEEPLKTSEKKVRGKSRSPLGGKLAGPSVTKAEDETVEPTRAEQKGITDDVKEGVQQHNGKLNVKDDHHNPDATLDSENEAVAQSDVGNDLELERPDGNVDADNKLDVAEKDELGTNSVVEDEPETNPPEKDEPETIIKVKEEPKTNPIVMVERGPISELKSEPNTSLDSRNEAEIGQVLKDESAITEGVKVSEDQLMEEAVEHENFEEEVKEDFAVVEAAEGEGEEGLEGGSNEEEGPKLEEEEQIQISDMAKARMIKKEQEIFVGGLDRDAVEDDLKKTFEKVGEVVEVRLHKDYATNKNKGFAFVKFASKEQAVRALEEMKNPLIRGKRCGIAPSEDNDTLFLGNICNTWTKEAIRRKLKDYGVDAVENITLVGDTQNEGLSRGFAFLEFACHTDAMAAYKRLQKPDVVFGHPERTAKVAFAEPLREPDPEVMAQVKSVFVDGLPPYWDEDHVKEQLKGYGEIERVVLARNMSTAKRKDFGFVNFASHEAAVACIEGINSTELGDGKSKVKARARLANPLPKTQAVKGGMSGGFRIGHTGSGGYSRFGRGFGRGRFPSNRAGFLGGRGFYPRGRGRGGRFPYVGDGMESSYPEFHGWRPYGSRGGRRGFTSGRLGAFDRGRGRAFPARRPPFPPEGDFGQPFGAPHFGEDSYFYGDGGHGLKRPFSMMEHDASFLERSNRLRPRYDFSDPLPGDNRYRDSLGTSGLYSRDYYGSDYGGSSYSSFLGGEPSGRGYYY
ncbi:Polyadenylate-binding protein 5 [Apostasia shenzhenica]|uniref:Polyadenylate-binding protein 5 n=1 Tax=Apostasia shenzhenica TaxID=1088818 RepID=A0A2H9ZXU2_9ASPA|nr:Polyadenylate-binding protein 5 [Apostasia shenzhenica]